MKRTHLSPRAGGTEMLVCFSLALAGGYFMLNLGFAHTAPSQQLLCWCFSQHMGLTWLHAGTADDGAVSSHPFPAISQGSRAAKPCLVFPPSQTLKPIQSVHSSLLHPLSLPMSPGLGSISGQEQWISLPTHSPVWLHLPQQTDFSDFLGCSPFSAPEL